MKKFTLAALPVMMLALAMPAVAQTKATGQTQPADKTQTTTPMEGELAKQPDMATTQAAGDADLGKLSEMMSKGDAMARKIETISAVGSVKVVEAKTLGASEADLQSAYDTNMGQIGALQASIAANTALKAKVAEQSIDTRRIVAAEIEADGSVTLYLRDKAS